MGVRGDKSCACNGDSALKLNRFRLGTCALVSLGRASATGEGAGVACCSGENFRVLVRRSSRSALRDASRRPRSWRERHQGNSGGYEPRRSRRRSGCGRRDCSIWAAVLCSILLKITSLPYVLRLIELEGPHRWRCHHCDWFRLRTLSRTASLCRGRFRLCTLSRTTGPSLFLSWWSSRARCLRRLVRWNW